MAYTKAPTPQPSINADDSCLRAFRTQLRFQDKSRINWVELPERHGEVLQLFRYNDGPGVATNVVTLEQYSDYFNLDLTVPAKLDAAAEKIGYMAASAYNALVGAAMRKHGFGVTITDPLVNNVKFNFVMNAEPSVADPECLIPGWASYRFVFGAGV